MDELHSQQKKFKCYKHYNRKAEYFVMNKNDFKTIAMCPYCALQENTQVKSLIIIEEIIQSDINSIIPNWPPINDSSLICKYQDICESLKSEDQTCDKQVQNIMDYFDKIKNDFNYKITILQKSIIQSCIKQYYEDFIGTYNQVSQKQKLQSFILENQIINESFQDFISQIGHAKEKNSQELVNIMNEYQEKSNAFNQDKFDQFFQEVYDALDCIEKKGINNNQFLFQRINFSGLDQDLQNLFINNISKQISTLSESIQSDFKTKSTIETHKCVKEMKNSLNDLQKQILIKMPTQTLQQRLIVNLKDNIRNSQPILVNQQQVHSTNKKIAFIDTPITQNNIGQSFKIKIINFDEWVGIGIVDKEKTLQLNHEFNFDNVSKMSSFLISSNGYSWNMLEGKPPYSENDCCFGRNDIIEITIKDKFILFNIETKNKIIKIDYSFSKNKEYCVGFRLSEDDIIEFM